MSIFKKLTLATVALTAAACATPPPFETTTGDYLSGRFAARFNNIDEAANEFAAATSILTTEDKLIRDAFFYHLAAGEIERALPFAAKLNAVETEDRSGLPAIALAAAAIKNGEFNAARGYLDTDLDDPFVRSIAHLMGVWIDASEKGPGAGLATLEAGGDDLFKGFSATHFALLLEASGNNDDAREAHDASFQGLGGPIGRSAFGAFLERQDDKEAARLFYDRLSQVPGPPRRMAEQGLARLDAGRTSRKFLNVTAQQGASFAVYSFAGAILEQAATQRERASLAGFNVGAPRYNLPLALGQIAIYLNPDLVEARRLVGSIFNVYEQYNSAARVLALIPADSPHFEQAQIEIATGLLQLDDEDGAVDTLRRTIAAEPNSQEARLTLANVYASIGDNERAIEEATKAIDRLAEDPQEDGWRYYVVRGGAYLEVDDWPKAEADLKRAVEIAPEEAFALNYLGYSWAERGINLEEAFTLIERAVALQPNNGAITDSLGWAFYQLGKYDEAVGHLERAASQEPADPTITDHLGDVYWKLNRKREARYQWKHAIGLEPKAELKQKLERKIEEGLDVVESEPDLTLPPALEEAAPNDLESELVLPASDKPMSL